MHRAERTEEIPHADALSLHLLQRLVRLLHLPDSVRKRIWIYAGRQFHIAFVAVIAQPVVRAPLTIGVHGQQDIVVQTAIFGEVIKDSLNGHL